MLCTKIVLNVRNNFCAQHVISRFELGIFMYWTCNSMNNLLSYCGLVNERISVSDINLPVSVWMYVHIQHFGFCYQTKLEVSFRRSIYSHVCHISRLTFIWWYFIRSTTAHVSILAVTYLFEKFFRMNLPWWIRSRHNRHKVDCISTPLAFECTLTVTSDRTLNFCKNTLCKNIIDGIIKKNTVLINFLWQGIWWQKVNR